MRYNDDERDCGGIVDDDAEIRHTVSRMLARLGVGVSAYGSAREYLDDQRRRTAIVFMSGCTDAAIGVEAMRKGAVDLLQRPFNEQQLLDSVQVALALEKNDRDAANESDLLAERRARRTPREGEVLARVLPGTRAKEIATDLGIATKTAEAHRSHVMQKMETFTVVGLLSMSH